MNQPPLGTTNRAKSTLFFFFLPLDNMQIITIASFTRKLQNNTVPLRPKIEGQQRCRSITVEDIIILLYELEERGKLGHSGFLVKRMDGFYT